MPINVKGLIEYEKYYSFDKKNKLLTPLSGQFEAAFWLNPPAGPPLSVEKTMIELWSILLARSSSTTRPTDSSSFQSIPVISMTV